MMGIKRDILQVIIGSMLLMLCIQTGILSPAKSWLDNLVVSVLITVLTRVLARVLG